jgi:acetyl-CoA carboxylase biotin carboxyl carrier protein
MTANPPSPPEDPFDLSKLRELVSMMEKHGLTEVDLRSGTERWRLRRGSGEPSLTPVPMGFPGPMGAPGYPMMPFPPGPYPMAPAPAAPATAAAPAAPAAELPAIKSPTVGTFYESAAPGEAPFVQVGTKVTTDSVVCIIEAMKVFNQITSDLTGTVTEVLVKNGDPVEYGQPLFRVRLG